MSPLIQLVWLELMHKFSITEHEFYRRFQTNSILGIYPEAFQSIYITATDVISDI
jgi:hypothetical protein